VSVQQVFFDLCEWIHRILGVELDAPSIFGLHPFAAERLYDAFSEKRSQRAYEAGNILWVTMFMLSSYVNIEPFNCGAIEGNVYLELVASDRLNELSIVLDLFDHDFSK
jgi:hypothetical protein